LSLGEYAPPFFSLLKFSVILFATGIFLTHLMRLSIKRLKLTEKPVSKQIIIAFLLNIFFSIFITAFSFQILFTEPWQQQPMSDSLYTIADTYLGSFGLLFGWDLIYFYYHYVQQIKKQEQEKATSKIKLLELEAKIMRAQMNPLFVFNCLNSIKTLMVEKQIDKGVNYLTTFSKLTRTLLNNAEKKEISLHDEIETAQLYLQLETIRLNGKFSFMITTDQTIDLKSITSPPLIIQSFVEHALWFGIMPKEGRGDVLLDVRRYNGNVDIIIDDNGLGRENERPGNSTENFDYKINQVSITQSKPKLDYFLQSQNATLEVIDKYDDNKIPTGTKIILRFKEID
jgi:sensor histidine kinase YesM